MPNLSSQLALESCPHCSVENPCLAEQSRCETTDRKGHNLRCWIVYACGNCGGLVTASAPQFEKPIQELFPSSAEVHQDIPAREKAFLAHAVANAYAPAGEAMLDESRVDEMPEDM